MCHNCKKGHYSSQCFSKSVTEVTETNTGYDSSYLTAVTGGQSTSSWTTTVAVNGSKLDMLGKVPRPVNTPGYWMSQQRQLVLANAEIVLQADQGSGGAFSQHTQGEHKIFPWADSSPTTPAVWPTQSFV